MKKVITLLTVVGLFASFTSAYADEATKKFVKDYGRGDELKKVADDTQTSELETKALEKQVRELNRISKLGDSAYNDPDLWDWAEWNRPEKKQLREKFEAKGVSFFARTGGKYQTLTPANQQKLVESIPDVVKQYQGKIEQEKSSVDKLQKKKEAIDRSMSESELEKMVEGVSSDPAILTKTLQKMVEHEKVAGLGHRLDGIQSRLDLTELLLRDSVVSHYMQKKMEDMTASRPFCEAAVACTTGTPKRSNFDRIYNRRGGERHQQ